MSAISLSAVAWVALTLLGALLAIAGFFGFIRPIHLGEPGFSTAFDGDGDGVGCES